MRKNILMNYTTVFAKANEGEGNKGIDASDISDFPKIKFDKLPDGIENGGDGRSARSEYNWPGLSVKEGRVVPRAKRTAATASANYFAEQQLKKKGRVIKFATFPSFDEDGAIITEKVVGEDGKERVLPVSYNIVMTSNTKAKVPATATTA